MITSLPTIYPGAEPFFFPGSGAKARIGALCVHGLAASPQEVCWLGKDMGRRGYTALGVRLPGHGVQFEEFHRVDYRQWYGAVQDGYHLLREQCDRIVVMGLSLGGLLSILLAADPVYRDSLAGLVVMGSPFRADSRILPLTHVLRWFRLTVATWDRAADPLDKKIRELQAERGEQVTGRGSYYRMTAAGVSELLRTEAYARESLSQVTAPTLLVYSHKDRTAPIHNFHTARNGLTNARILEAMELHESGHIITCDLEHESVFDRISGFIASHVET